VSRAENAAERLVAELSISSPKELQIEDIAWTRGVLVCYQRLDGAAARLVVRGPRGLITVSTALPSVGQRRFAVAHELGHLELHRRENSLSLCVAEELEARPSSSASEPEQEANEFAGALLMPSTLLSVACRNATPSMTLVRDLAETFDTSLTATAIRYTAVSREACAIVWSQKGYIRWYRASRDFGYHVKVGEELDRYSIAFDFFQGKTLPSRPTAVDASCWLAPGRYEKDAMIKEDSYALPSYEGVLTLLWLDTDIERDYDPAGRADRRWRR